MIKLSDVLFYRSWKKIAQCMKKSFIEQYKKWFCKNEGWNVYSVNLGIIPSDRGKPKPERKMKQWSRKISGSVCPDPHTRQSELRKFLVKVKIRTNTMKYLNSKPKCSEDLKRMTKRHRALKSVDRTLARNASFPSSASSSGPCLRGRIKKIGNLISAPRVKSKFPGGSALRRDRVFYWEWGVQPRAYISGFCNYELRSEIDIK